MSSSPVINALVTKRAELAGVLSDLERCIAAARADLAHVDATLVLFDPSIKPITIRAKPAAPNRSAHFAVGEIARRCRNALRTAGPNGVTAGNVAMLAILEKGINPTDAAILKDFTTRVYWSLSRLAQEGHARKTGQGVSARWATP